MTTIPTEDEPTLDHYQRESIRAAIGRELSRIVKPSRELQEAKARMDDAIKKYRDLVRAEARMALERY